MADVFLGAGLGVLGLAGVFLWIALSMWAALWVDEMLECEDCARAAFIFMILAPVFSFIGAAIKTAS